MGIQLQQIGYYLTLQAAEGRRSTQRFPGGAYRVDRNMGCQIHRGSSHRLQGTTVPVRCERASDRTTLHGVAIVDHESAASAFHDHLDELGPCHVPGETDLGAPPAGPPAVGPRKALILESRSRLLQAVVVDDHLPPAIGTTADDRAGQVVQPFTTDDHHRLGFAEYRPGLTAGPAPIPYVPQILGPANLLCQLGWSGS